MQLEFIFITGTKARLFALNDLSKIMLLVIVKIKTSIVFWHSQLCTTSELPDVLATERA